ncbi:MAG: hypothetical protein JW940_36510 [Polyangiaceae bacterium]|nr:hypothetical protein [Polyangiaceae bacterium]
MLHRSTLSQWRLDHALLLAAALGSSLFESSAAHAQAPAPVPSAVDASTDGPTVPSTDETAAPGTNTEPSTVPNPSTEGAPVLSSSGAATADAVPAEPSERTPQLAADARPVEVARPVVKPPSAAAPTRFPSSATESDPRRDTSARRDRRNELRTLGAQLDLGLPDGLMAGVCYRPLEWLRLHAGAGTNAVSPGVRAGALVVPLGVGPSLALEAGHYFEGDANAVAGAFSGPQYQDNSMAEEVGYDFFNAHLGLEVGAERLTFFLHGGASYVRAELHHVNDVLGESEGDTTITLHGNPRITAWLPSFKLGFVLHIV